MARFTEIMTACLIDVQKLNIENITADPVIMLDFINTSSEASFKKTFGILRSISCWKICILLWRGDKLKELEQVMLMIQARLSDAERLREDEEGALVKLWLKRLKHVLYRLEALFEEVSFANKEMELMGANKLTKAICFPISKLSVLNMNKRVIHYFESIMRELEGITSDMHKLQLRVHSYEGQCSPNMMSTRETRFYFGGRGRLILNFTSMSCTLCPP
ncbi:Histidine--tRNA ligase [Bienertia sinuspersici]